MERSIEKKLVELYLSGSEVMGEESPAVLNRPRSAALESFNLLGIPPKGSGNGDRYHYIDLREVFAHEYEYYFTPSYGQAAVPELPMEGHRIALMNGFCRGAALTRLDNGVVFGSLAAAAAQQPELVGRYYNTLADNPQDAFSALSTMFAQDGVFVYVPAGVEQTVPFVIDSAMCGEGEAVCAYARNLFVFERGSAATLVLNYQSVGEERLLGCQTREVVVAEGARVEMAELYRLNDASSFISGSYARQDRNSLFHSLSVSLSGSVLRSNQTVSLDGPGTENHTNGLMLSSGTEKFDYATDIRHNVPDCTSHEHFKGIASEAGSSIFSGRIYVAPDAQRTRAYQQNNALVLSDEAHIYTKPQLEIYADDVKCSHGATVGQLDAEAIYYMRQRGISLEEARRLQMYGFVRDVLSKTRIEGLDEQLDAMAVAKIDRF